MRISNTVYDLNIELKMDNAVLKIVEIHNILVCSYYQIINGQNTLTQ